LTRTRYQFGSLRRKERKKGPDAWEFRYYETVNGTRKRVQETIGTVERYPTEAAARKAVEGLLLKLNADSPQGQFVVPSFGALIDRYLMEELPERYSTRKSYESVLENHIRLKWGDHPLDGVKPMAVEHWLKQLDLAPKTKGHSRSLMHLLFECAMRWDLIQVERNPMSLVRVKGCTKRLKRPRILTIEEVVALLSRLREPFRTMVLVAVCLGLRVSEIVGLKWCDFDFENLTLLVQRSVVHGRVDSVKTEYSKDELPLDAQLARKLKQWREQSPCQGGDDWVFANPSTGKPYHQEEIQKKHLKSAAQKAGIGDDLGWHTFRHTYRSWLDETGAPIKVQQELMRHASIQTTMNVYGKAMSDSKREANRRIAKLVLPVAVGQEQRPEKEKGLLPAPSPYVN
jgi:integrase